MGKKLLAQVPVRAIVDERFNERAPEFATAEQGQKADAALPASARGAADGVASLVGGKVPSGQVPMSAIAGAAEMRAAFVSLAAAAKNPDLLIAGNVTRDANQAVTLADVVWPDGTVGTFTALSVSTAFPGAVDSYKITYGSPVTKTFTQPAVTRNAAGAATAVPQIEVS